MKLASIGTRGTLVSFPDLHGTNVYVIEGRRFRFFLDTFLGPDPMLEVRAYMRRVHGEKTIVAFNSHADWDHVWGNLAFRDSMILAHSACTQRIVEEGPEDLIRYNDHKKGEVILVPPNVLFETRLAFPEERLCFFHSPGHTHDSASCLDEVDRVLFAGDNVESPLPYVSRYVGLDAYTASLKEYLELVPHVVIPGHGDPAGLELVRENLSYLRLLSTGKEPASQGPDILARHAMNVEALR